MSTKPAPGRASAHASALAFAKCMRANGVPNFPDPTPGSGLEFPVSKASLTSPALSAARAKCQKLVPGGLSGPLNGAPASRQTLDKLLTIARCMRKHGVSQFPDPLSRMPANLALGDYEEITNYYGAILLFPKSLDLQSPAYKQALTACGAPPLGLPH